MLLVICSFVFKAFFSMCFILEALVSIVSIAISISFYCYFFNSLIFFLQCLICLLFNTFCFIFNSDHIFHPYKFNLVFFYILLFSSHPFSFHNPLLPVVQCLKPFFIYIRYSSRLRQEDKAYPYYSIMARSKSSNSITDMNYKPISNDASTGKLCTKTHIHMRHFPAKLSKTLSATFITDTAYM